MESTSTGSRRGGWWRRLWIAVLIGAGLLTLLVAAIVAAGWTAFGKAPQGERRAHMERSPQWHNGVFANENALYNDILGSIFRRAPAEAVTRPTEPVDVISGDGSRFATPPQTGLRITWMGHSSTLVEIDGRRVLFDPIFGDRASPLTWLGPARWYAPPIALESLPSVDAVVISHDHYDHLNYPTIRAIRDWDTRFIAPLGVGAHLAYWGVPAERITEVDWWDEVSVADLRIVATPSRHASGRHVLDQNRTLWAGYALVGPHHRVFYSGDTGLFPGFRDIAKRLGPFDATMIEIGAYDRAWPDWHIGPEQAVQAHQMLDGAVLLPVHWGLWSLAKHGWTDPAERVAAAAQAAGVKLAMPRPGESVEPALVGPLQRWWPELPWQSADDDPIIATRNGDPADRWQPGSVAQ